MGDCVAHLREGWYGNVAIGKAAVPRERLIERAKEDADRRMVEVGGLSGSMDAGVQVVGDAKVFSQDDAATDMSAKPEPWDLTGTADDEDEDGKSARSARRSIPRPSWPRSRPETPRWSRTARTQRRRCSLLRLTALRWRRRGGALGRARRGRGPRSE